jgi:hypothetical protein
MKSLNLEPSMPFNLKPNLLEPKPYSQPFFLLKALVIIFLQSTHSQK